MASKAQRRTLERLKANISMLELAASEASERVNCRSIAALSTKAMAITTLAILIREDCARLMHGKEMLNENTTKP